jgi:hypothetical protein
MEQLISRQHFDTADSESSTRDMNENISEILYDW